jgi:ribose transport system substrate-binding protein
MAGELRSAALILMAIALGIGACGADDEPAAKTGATKAAASGLDVDATLASAYEGIVDEVPASGPVAERGKTIWFSNCLGFEGCARFGDGVKAAGKALGWTIKEVDNENNPSKSIAIIRQAIAANADGVIDTLSDCPNIKAGLQAAKTAGVPVITYAGLDCDNPEFGGGEPLYAAPFKLGERADALDYYREQGGRDAEFIIALARKRGLETPAILQTQNENQLFQRVRAEGFKAKVAEVCPDCKLEPLLFTTEQPPACSPRWRPTRASSRSSAAATAASRAWRTCGAAVSSPTSTRSTPRRSRCGVGAPWT